MSNASGPSARATCSVRPSSRLTPRLMLAARMIAVRRAASRTVCSSSALRPVVPITWPVPHAAASAACAAVAAGAENSITTSALSIRAAASVLTVTPSGP